MIWLHNWFVTINYHNAGILLAYIDIEWTRRRSLKTGTKTRFASELEDMLSGICCFCWRICAKLSQFPVESRGVYWRAGFLFAGRATKKLPMPFTFGFVVAQTIKQLLKTNRNRTSLACTWSQRSPENDREKCLQLALAVTNLTEHLIKTTDWKLNKTRVPS